jgi:anti-sigma regulatory factor (Ser/Thr protein kinase)
MLHFKAASAECESLAPTTAPLGTMAQIGSKAARILDLEPGDVFVLCSDGVFDHRNPAGEDFGVGRVAALLSEFGDRPMGELLGRVLGAMEEFGQGAPQDDDVTVVLIRRLPDSADSAQRASPRVAASAGAPVRENFPRDLAALSRMFDFVAAFIEREQLGASERYAIGFTLEELFTNILKYGGQGTGEIEVMLERRGGEVVGSIVNPDAGDFNVSSTPDVDISLPADKRRTGGLGLHLIRRVMDAVEYEYTGHASRITFRKKVEVR